MELICPSCEARYQLPEGSIGEKGRQVSCMNCGHGWHAFPPLVLGSGQRTKTSAEQVGITYGSAAAVQAPPPPRTRPAPPPETDFDSAAPSENIRAQRTEQLAEIREMLAEVQAEEDHLTVDTRGTEDPVAPRRSTEEAHDEPFVPDPTLEAEKHEIPGATDTNEDAVDPLRARLNQQANERNKPKEVDVKRLRKRHERRERARSRDRQAGSGAFLTGFLLIAMVAAVMIGLYVLHPLIIQRMPQAEPALTEYVDTIDGLRVTVAESFEKARSWVMERTEKS